MGTGEWVVKLLLVLVGSDVVPLVVVTGLLGMVLVRLVEGTCLLVPEGPLRVPALE